MLDVLMASGVGLGVGVMGTRWFDQRRESRLPVPTLEGLRKSPAALADFLNWGALVAPGVLMNKDGAFVAGWKVRGPDMASMSADDRNQHARYIDNALAPFADGWMFHVSIIRRPSVGYGAEGSFRDPATWVVDWERRMEYEARGTRYESEMYLVATYLPPPERSARFSAWLFQGEVRRPGWQGGLDSFVRQMRELGRRLEGRLRVEWLGSDALLTHLHECLTGLDHPVRAPSVPCDMDLNLVLVSQDYRGGYEPRMGRKHQRILAVQGFPYDACPGILEDVLTQALPFRWTHRIVPLGRETALRLMKQQQIGYVRSIRSAQSMLSEVGKSEKSEAERADERLFEDSHARSMAEELREAMAGVRSGATRYCNYTSNVVVFDETEEKVEERAQSLVKKFGELGFTVRVEEMNARDAFFGSLPGHGKPNLRRMPVQIRNVVDMISFTSMWPGHQMSPHPKLAGLPALMVADGEGSTPFWVNLHHNDRGHTIVVGSTGAGKSILVESVVAQWMRYPGAQAFVFDKGNSFEILAHAVGGHHYDITDDAITFSLQPLVEADDVQERGWIAVWLQEYIFEPAGLVLTPSQKNELAEALAIVGEGPSEWRTFSELWSQVQDEQMREVLFPLSEKGSLGWLYGGTRDGIQEGSFQVFELDRLLSYGEKVALPAITYILHRLEGKLDGVRPTLFVIEEAKLVLAFPRFAEKIEEFLLTLRKKNAAVLLVMQNIGQMFERSLDPVRGTIIDSCKTHFFLPNSGATNEDQAERYALFGLGQVQIGAIARAVDKRDYFFSNPDGMRLFELSLGPVAWAFFAPPPGMSLREAVRRIRSLKEREGARWVAAWLVECAERMEASVESGAGERAARLRAAAAEVHRYLGERDEEERARTAA